MFNLGPGELIVILVLALIIFGPGRLPEVGRAVGKTINEFKRAMSEPEREIPRQTSAPPPEPSPARLVQNSTTNESNKG